MNPGLDALQEELNQIHNLRIDAMVLFSRARILWLMMNDNECRRSRFRQELDHIFRMNYMLYLTHVFSWIMEEKEKQNVRD